MCAVEGEGPPYVRNTGAPRSAMGARGADVLRGVRAARLALFEKGMRCAPTVIGSRVKPIRAEVPRALCYPASPPPSQRTGIQAAAPTTPRLARSHRGELGKIDYTPRRAAFPHAVAPFIPPFMCTIGIVLFFFFLPEVWLKSTFTSQ